MITLARADEVLTAFAPADQPRASASPALRYGHEAPAVPTLTEVFIDVGGLGRR